MLGGAHEWPFEDEWADDRRKGPEWEAVVEGIEWIRKGWEGEDGRREKQSGLRDGWG